MSKTPFRMPNRTDSPASRIDQWVVGEEKATNSGTRPERGKLARLTIDLPSELHARFKATCALKGIRMNDEVRQFIEDWTQKNG